ncbi:MAG: nucleoside 2-deoxyribosyltransferase [Nitrososphaerales archaeon]
MKVYLAVPLVSNRSIERTRIMAKAIRDLGHEVASPWNLDPLEVSAPSAVNVFERDRTGSEAADVMVADVTDPSTGVGMEVMAAYKAGRRIILVSKRGKRISTMLEDMDGKERVEYNKESEIYEGLLRALR